jgi:hypothetical protein
MPPKVEDDDDALLDVMRHDGYHVKAHAPSLVELKSTTHRVHPHGALPVRNMQTEAHAPEDANEALVDEVMRLTDKPTAFLQTDKKTYSPQAPTVCS